MGKITVRKMESFDRNILIGMITNENYLRQIFEFYDRRIFQDQIISTLIAGWCIDFFKEHDSCPNKIIQNIFNEWAEQTSDEDHIPLVQELLKKISKQYEFGDKFNVPYYIKKAKEQLKRAKIKELMQKLRSMNKDNKFDDAEDLITSYIKDPSTGHEVPKLDIASTWINAFNQGTKPIFTLPGALGTMFNDEFVRGAFIGFMGRDKIGKSHYLLEIAIRAWQQGLNVAIFEAGDMSKDLRLIRIGSRLSHKPYKKKHCGTFLEPVLDCMKNQYDECSLKKRTSDIGLMEGKPKENAKFYSNYVQRRDKFNESKEDGYVPCTECYKDFSVRKKLFNRYKTDFEPAVWYKEVTIKEPLTGNEAYEAFDKFTKLTRARKDRLYISTHSSDTLSVDEAESIILSWEQRFGFSPDVILFDYADILYEPGQDKRIAEYRKWLKLRSLATKRDCIVLTVTQISTTGYDKRVIQVTDFSETKGKLAHVTCMGTFNQTFEEKVAGIIRIGKVLAREDDFDANETVTVIQSIKNSKTINGSFFSDSTKRLDF